jgi:uncharacterized linocin/CFP29 family protein
MNNLHRELAPVSDEAWAQIEQEVARTFKRHLAGRRVVDVHGPEGETLAAVGTGRLHEAAEIADGVQTWQRGTLQLVQLRAPFTLSRAEIDAVSRGALDSDWQPAKDAARQIALAEDKAVFAGYHPAGITGIMAGASSSQLPLPGTAATYPDVITSAIGQLRAAGVDGPYAAVLSADAYALASEASDHGYPVLRHLQELLDGGLIWAPAISGAVVLTLRGGDFMLHLGQDLSIGYDSHSGTEVSLYLQESMTFQLVTEEAAVALTA